MKHKQLFFLGALLIAIALIGTSSVIATNQVSDHIQDGAPGEFNYQGLLLDPGTGEPVADGPYDFGFAIYDVATGGMALWSETQTNVSVQAGLFNVRLGDSTPISPTDWVDGRDLWLGITVEGDSEMTPRQPLVSVPYAMNAGDVRGADIHPDNVYVTGIVSVTGGITITNWGQVIDPNGNWVGPALPGITSLCGHTETCLGDGVQLINGANYSFQAIGGQHSVWGQDGSRTGVWGTQGPPTGIVNTTGTPPYGVWGDSGGEGTVGVLGTQVGVPGTAGVSGVNGRATGILGPMGPGQYGVWGEVAPTDDAPGADGVFGTVLPSMENSGNSGVHGIVAAASGVWGFQNLGPTIGPTDYGVWGDNASHTPESAGVLGTVLAPDLSAAGVWGINNGPVSPPRFNPFPFVPAPIESAGPDAATADYGMRGMTDSPVPGSAGVLGETQLDFTAGVYGRCTIPWSEDPPSGCFGVFSDGDSMTNGNIYATGIKAAIVETSQGLEPLWAIESTDVEFYANGEAQLENGIATIQFERLFHEAISADVPVRVVLTPVGGWSGLYIESQTHEGFTVHSGAGDPNVTFNWIAIGRRKGYEDRPSLDMSEFAPENLAPSSGLD